MVLPLEQLEQAGQLDHWEQVGLLPLLPLGNRLQGHRLVFLHPLLLLVALQQEQALPLVLVLVLVLVLAQVLPLVLVLLVRLLLRQHVQDYLNYLEQDYLNYLSMLKACLENLPVNFRLLLAFLCLEHYVE